MYYSPWQFVNEINTLLEDSVAKGLKFNNSEIKTTHWMPLVDIKEQADHYLIFADVPGVSPSSIEISMQDNDLIIKGAREQVATEEKKNYVRTERTSGNFYRRFHLPESIDSENIKAVSKNGVLEITLPKRQRSGTKKIEIQTAE